jgi:hypothetical protein
MSKPNHQLPSLLPPSPVLVTECSDEFARFFEAVKEQLKVSGIVDYLLVTDYVELEWEVRRYRRVRTSIINSAVLPAIKNILTPIVRSELAKREPPKSPKKKTAPTLSLDFSFEPDELDLKAWGEANRLAHGWFVDEPTKQSILEMLEERKLDEYAIEAEAMRIAAPDLEKFDRLMRSREWRRDRALRSIAEFCGKLGRQVQAAVERVIDGEVLPLDDASKKSAAA